jgi:glycosyltransferase involved in cell wall biosynthesis
MTFSDNSSKIPSLSLVSWALNEEENVLQFVQRAVSFCKNVTEDFEIVIIDDGSTDNTFSILMELRKEIPNLIVHKNERNLGVGFSMQKAIQLSSKEFLIWQTQDWSYDLSWFTENISQVTNYDVIHGVRDLRFSLNDRSDNKVKALISLLNYVMIRMLFGSPFSDYQNVTLYRTKMVQSVDLVSESSFTSPELLLRMWLDGKSFLEVPVKFHPRLHGKAKGTRFSALVRSFLAILHFRVFVWKKIPSQNSGVISKW